MIEILWEFKVRPGQRADFERDYSSSGVWAKFFNMDPAYCGTVLLRDASHPDRYLTRDRWHDLNSFHSFKERFQAKYTKINRQCEAYTIEEDYLGAFEVVE